MRCTRCGHPYRNHVEKGDRACRMRIAYDWNERRKTFMKSAPCRCPGYRGVIPDHECPHDYTKADRHCVYCGHVRSVWERQR